MPTLGAFQAVLVRVVLHGDTCSMRSNLAAVGGSDRIMATSLAQRLLFVVFPGSPLFVMDEVSRARYSSDLKAGKFLPLVT